VRIAVISPFLDRQHGTERCLIEQLERFPVDAGTEIHIYSQQIHDLRGVMEYQAAQTPQPQPGTYLFWHKVPSIPGPHVLQYAFWFFANRLRRWRDRKFHGLKYDLVYSPGINATDADAIAVHIVFHEFYRQVRSEIGFRTAPVKKWPLLLHRRLYYRLIMALEKRVYRQPGVSLAAVSDLVAQQLKKYFDSRNVRVIRNGVDAGSLSVSARLAKRAAARKHFQLSETDFALLLIGNDWKKKGLDGLLRALVEIRELPWKLLVVGSDERGSYEKVVHDSGSAKRVSFLTPSPDVLQFYAAADAYVGPSLEDAYGLPVLEAMACGLPVVSSSCAGVSEIIVHGKNGLVLQNPRDTQEISAALQSLISSPAFCRQLGEQAALTAQSNTWARNAQAAWEWLSEALRQKNSSPEAGEQVAVAGAAARSASST
jgi:glycosyltransferase involved in cell wall biosynthesis